MKQTNLIVASLILQGLWPVYGEGDGDGAGAGDGQGAGDGDGDGTGDGTGDGQGAGDGTGDDGKPTDREAQLLKENMKKKEKLKEISGQLETLTSEREQLTTQLSELQAFKESLGDVDVEQIKQLLADQAKQEEAKMAQNGEWDALRERLSADHQRQLDQVIAQHNDGLTAKEAELTAAQEALTAAQSQIEELTIGRNFSDSKAIGEKTTMSPNIARTMFGAHFDVAEDGKSVVGYDKPRGVEDRSVLVDGKARPLAFDDALLKLVETHPDKEFLLRAEGSPGAGSGSKVRGGKGAGDGEQPAASTGRAKIAAGLSSLNAS